MHCSTWVRQMCQGARERQERGLEFVAGVLRTYDGQDFIYQVKNIFKQLTYSSTGCRPSSRDREQWCP